MEENIITKQETDETAVMYLERAIKWIKGEELKGITARGVNCDSMELARQALLKIIF